MDAVEFVRKSQQGLAPFSNVLQLHEMDEDEK